MDAQDRACLRRAVRAGAHYIANEGEGQLDLAHVAIADYLFRRWGVVPLAHMRQEVTDSPGALPRRDPGVRFFGVMPELSRRASQDFLPAVLACERRPLTASNVESFHELVAGGGAEAATGLLWLRIAQELGCVLPAGIDQRRTVDAVARGLARERDVVTRTSVMQATVLTVVGEGSRVPADWTERLRANQQADGSWLEADGIDESLRWNPTLYAIWYLLMVSDPDAADPGLMPPLTRD